MSAKFVIATELFIAVGLWSRRTRYAAVWVAVCFHVAIQLSADVEVFSYLAIAALVIWAVPSTRDRVLVRRPGERRHRRARRDRRPRLDWLARFRIEPAPPGTPLTRRRPRRRVVTGGRAAASSPAACRSTAWFALPDARSSPGCPAAESTA